MSLSDPDAVLPLSDPVTVGPPDIASLSSEARLATAIVMQAQVLEGLRRDQSDLVGRLGRETRPSRWGLPVSVAVLLATVVGAAVWVSGELPAPFDDGALQAALADAREEQLAGLGELRGDVEASRAGLAELGRGFGERLAQQDAALLVAVDERDSARAELERTREQLAAEVARGEELAGARQAATAEAEAAGSERNALIGENGRLRDQLLANELQLEELRATVANLDRLESAAVAARVPPAERDDLEAGAGGEASLVTEIGELLRAAGAGQVRLAEVGGVAEGELHDLLLMAPDASGTDRILRAERARLATGLGVARLELEGLVALDGDEASGPLPAAILLPTLDPPAWRRLGLRVPADALASQVREAVDRLLTPFGARLAALDGVAGETLHGVVVEELDAQGVLQRRLRAARARFAADAQELVLEDGTVESGGELRPFWNGALRLPVPGLDTRAWTQALSLPGSLLRP